MTLRADIWEGMVRRHELKVSLKQEARGQKNLSQVNVEAAPTPQDLLKKDLHVTQQKNKKYLSSPGAGKKSVGKLKLFLLFLLFLLAGFLFFVGGFLTCYTQFPPALDLAEAQASHLQVQALEGTSHGVSAMGATDSFARRQLVARGQSTNGFSERTQRQAAQIATAQARGVASQAVGRISMGIQSALGPYVGRFITPLVNGVGSSAINAAMTPGQSLSSTKGQAGAHATTSTVNGQGNGALTSSTASEGEGQVASSSAPSRNRFTLVVQEFSLSQEALMTSDALRSQGFDGYVVEEQRGTSDVVYVVKAGQFATYQEARESAALLGRLWQRPVRVTVAGQDSE